MATKADDVGAFVATVLEDNARLRQSLAQAEQEAKQAIQALAVARGRYEDEIAAIILTVGHDVEVRRNDGSVIPDKMVMKKAARFGRGNIYRIVPYSDDLGVVLQSDGLSPIVTETEAA